MLAIKRRALLLSLAVLVLDQYSKWLVEVKLEPHLPHEIIPGLLNFTYVQNTGVAFGLFAARGRMWITAGLVLLGLTALGLVAVYFRRTPESERWTILGLGLVLGGAVGNLIDRLTTGAVTDFIDFYLKSYHWHTFNIADSAITVGIGLMAIDVLARREPAEESVEESA